MVHSGNDGDAPEDEFPLGEGTADMAASVTCPHCAQLVEVALDPGSGSDQRYTEDCEVCCRPWVVTVRYDASGGAHVWLEPVDA